MATIHGKLNPLAVPEPPYSPYAATVDIALCGYGSRSPVTQGAGGENGCLCSVAIDDIPPSQPGNAFEVELVGNDLIVPAGTYYTVTFKDPNGDVLQVNAYIFLDSGDYDLSGYPPFNPTEPPPPPAPPLIVNQLLVVPFSPTPNFAGDVYTTWGIILTGDVTASSLSGIVAGNLYTFLISQGAGGGWTFVWPSSVLNAMQVSPTQGAMSIQTFVAISNNGPLLAIGPGTYYP